MIVHQIFGLLGDKEMNELFTDCQKKVIKWCRCNDYHYRLWDKKSCERLIKKYPEFDELYHSVKYPIMKVDIIRFIILHYYGGLYLDLDVIPNETTKLKDYQFAIAETKGYKKKSYELEILQSVPCNNLLLDYLKYVKTQIEEKDKIKIYDSWKIRYVYQTTGPHSFNRWLKGKEFKTYGRKGARVKNDIDCEFISHISCSYSDNGKMRD